MISKTIGFRGTLFSDTPTCLFLGIKTRWSRLKMVETWWSKLKQVVLFFFGGLRLIANLPIWMGNLATSTSWDGMGVFLTAYVFFWGKRWSKLKHCDFNDFFWQLILSGIDGDSNIGGKKHNLQKKILFSCEIAWFDHQKGWVCWLYLQHSAAEIWSCSMCSILHGYRSKFYPKKNSCGKLNFAIANITSGWYHQKKGVYITLWLFNIAMENGPFIDDFPIKTSIYKGFSMAMLNYQRVLCLPQHMIVALWYCFFNPFPTLAPKRNHSLLGHFHILGTMQLGCLTNIMVLIIVPFIGGLTYINIM